MYTRFYYYTGTGNSLWVARKLGEVLDSAEIVPLPKDTAAGEVKRTDCLGLVFPVYMWGVPAKVLEFVHTVVKSQREARSQQYSIELIVTHVKKRLQRQQTTTCVKGNGPGTRHGVTLWYALKNTS